MHNPNKYLLATPIDEPIATATLISLLASPPWHPIPGTFNLRAVSHDACLKGNHVYRSGLLSMISDAGKKDLVDVLGIRAIFDFRFNQERESEPEPSLQGVASILTEQDEEDAEWTSLVDMYFSFLETHRSIYKKVFLHILDNPKWPFLVHCTAGKDRTGVAVALIQSIAGVPREDIVYEYTLTRIGIEPVRDLLQAKLAGGDGSEVNWDNENLKTIAGCTAETMEVFLDKMLERFGSVHGFVKTELGFTDKDIDVIRQNLQPENL